MASLFDAIDAAGQAVISDRVGEAVTFIGMMEGEYSRNPDPMRPRQDAVAVLAISPRIGRLAEGIQGRSSTGAARAHLNNELWMTAEAFAELAWRPKRDDVVLVGEGGAREFSISAVLPLVQGDVQILLNEGRRDK
jgi:hypothetical protein